MIRGTKNEGFASLSKQRHTAGGTVAAYTGTKSELYETVDAAGVIGEVQDAFTAHALAITEFPSNAFNGTFE